MPFSRRTYAALAEKLSKKGHSDLEALFYRLGLEAYDEGGNLTVRALALVRAVESGSALSGTIDEITVELLEEVAGHIAWNPSEDKLVQLLALDGFTYADRKIIPAIPTEVENPAEVSKLEATLLTKGLDVCAKHYRQAVDTFVQGKHEASNGQLRSAVEAFFQMMPKLVGKQAALNTQAGIQVLQQSQVLDKAEEALAKGFWNVIQDEGPHAGLTSEKEAAFRFHMASSLMAYMLTKLNAQ